MARFLAVLLLSAAITSPALAQAPVLTLPEPSQQASITQRVGLTDLTVTFHRPAVRKRPIWGTVVPFGEVWRAGANENTVLTLSSPATIGGQQVPAGAYGVHMIPAKGDWTIILSKESTAWGSFFYDQKNDAARFTVTPRPAEHQEHLGYSFEDPTETGVSLVMRWEKLAVPIAIAVDTSAVVLESLRRELHGLPGFFWQSLARAANWAAQHNASLDEADAWADRAVSLNRNFTTLRAKALVAEKRGDAAAGASLRQEALTLANEADMNAHGYELLQSGKVDEAIEVFRNNTKKYPESWNVYDSLGEALALKGDKAGAKMQYEKALSMVRDAVNRKRIEGILTGLNSGTE
jgi:hypothetical protein